MLELGAYWGFYSLWFYKAVPNASCFLVEPLAYNLKCGQDNFRVNGYPAVFHQAYVGDQDGVARDSLPIISVDGFCRNRGISHLSILHSDIQGFELDMLRGATEMLGNRKIDFIFISTHSNELHAQCVEFLKTHNYPILVSVDLDQSFSIDGLIVARRAELPDPRSLEVSQRGQGG